MLERWKFTAKACAPLENLTPGISAKDRKSSASMCPEKENMCIKAVKPRKQWCKPHVPIEV